jgi:hypothetical protein
MKYAWVFLFVLSLVAKATEPTESKTTKTGATFIRVSDCELKELKVDPDAFTANGSGEAWRAPDTVKQTGAFLALEGTASTLKYTGTRSDWGMIWGDQIVETDDSPRWFETAKDASDYCVSRGAVLPTVENFLDLRAYFGAKWDNTDGKLYTNTGNYEAEVLPSLITVVHGTDVTYRTGICYWAQGGKLFDGASGAIQSYCASDRHRRDKARGHQARCVLTGKMKNSSQSVPAVEHPGFSDFRSELDWGFSNGTQERYPNDASRAGERPAYLFQPRYYYESNTVKPRAYEN